MRKTKKKNSQAKLVRSLSSNPQVKISIGTGDKMVELKDGDILQIKVEQVGPAGNQKCKDVLKRASRKRFFPLEPYEEYRLYKQGNQWCAVDKDFVNLDESIAGFGASPQQALTNLVNKLFE